MSAFEQLKDKLREIFQLDRTDLDFGLYRVMNMKSDEIRSFIDNDLLPQIKECLAKYTSGSNSDTQEELKKLEETLRIAGMNPDESPKVQELKAKLKDSFDAEKIENEIYSDLYNFFKRYYSDGDFLSLRRYKEGVYAIPYEGEEVKLHWANADQYYIKSAENLANYTFRVGKYKVRFEVIDATTEQNNNKDDKNRRFEIVEDNPVRFENGEYIISFTYLPDASAPKQEDLNKHAADLLLQNKELMPIVSELTKIVGTEKNKMTTIQKHLNNFTAKNSFDYFIHKDLGKFLRRELDFYIKNEIMHLDDIETETAPHVEQYLGKVKVLRKVATKIIQFLANLEDSQKKLWLKKKFVLETNYCITLDRVPEELYSEIVKNEKQREEWVRLFAIDEITENGKTLLENKVFYTEPLTIEFLKANLYLVLDTAFFDNDFKYKLLSSIDNIDEQCDGLLIHSENFQALNLLQEKYKEKIDCIYIDPPYNTEKDRQEGKFIYKDNYDHSCWLSLMQDRLNISKYLMNNRAIQFISIGDDEVNRLNILASDILKNLDMFTWQKTTTPPNLSMKTKKSIEYILSYYKDNCPELFGISKSSKSSNGLMNQTNKEKELVFPANKIDTNLDDGIYKARIYGTNAYKIELLEDTEVKSGYFVLPIKLRGKFKWNQENLNRELQSGTKVSIKTIAFSPSYERLEYEAEKPWNIIFNKDVGIGTNENASTELGNIFKSVDFNYPKPSSLIKFLIDLPKYKEGYVLDYFAGSGTTGHAVINLNREDGGSRKYILVEMGKYFDSVTKPRIEKVVYSDEWKDGKPVSRKGSSHCFKYIRLESYEDALDNLKFSRTEQQNNLLLQENTNPSKSNICSVT